MNIITCAALLCLHVDWISYDKRVIFGACLIISFMGLFATNALLSLSDDDKTEYRGNKTSSETKESKTFSEGDKSKESDDIEKQKLLEA